MKQNAFLILNYSRKIDNIEKQKKTKPATSMTKEKYVTRPAPVGLLILIGGKIDSSCGLVGCQGGKE